MELTYLQELQQMYSDIYKDVTGIRPSCDMTDPFWHSEQMLRDAIADLEVQLEGVMEEEAAIERACTERFEQLVSNVISMGARNRTTAIRWLDQAADTNGDMDYLCWQHGLPYGYLKAA